MLAAMASLTKQPSCQSGCHACTAPQIHPAPIRVSASKSYGHPEQA